MAATPVLEGVGMEVEDGGSSARRAVGLGQEHHPARDHRLQAPLAGSDRLGGDRAEIGILFQDDALLPWRSARRRMSRSASGRAAGSPDARTAGRGMARAPRPRRARQAVVRATLGRPRKRVAMAQVLALEPQLLLMDEPFSALDAIGRARLSQDLLKLVERAGI